jgi:hypothetical protein
MALSELEREKRLQVELSKITADDALAVVAVLIKHGQLSARALKGMVRYVEADASIRVHVTSFGTDLRPPVDFRLMQTPAPPEEILPWEEVNCPCNDALVENATTSSDANS